MTTDRIPECPRCHRPGIKNGDEYLCLDHGTFEPGVEVHQAGPGDQPAACREPGRQDVAGEGLDPGHQLTAGGRINGSATSPADDQAQYLAAQIPVRPGSYSPKRTAWDEVNVPKIWQLVDLVGRNRTADLVEWPHRALGQFLRLHPRPGAAGPAETPAAGEPAGAGRPGRGPLDVERLAAALRGDRRLPLPAWRDDWPAETQVQWLRIWREIYAGELRPGGEV